MSKQKFEIEADVPDGWVGVEYRRLKADESAWILKDGQAVWWDGSPTSSVHYLILRRVEPKKESRWCVIPEDTFGVGYDTREAAAEVVQVGRRLVIERRDYEDGKLVSVALEPTS